MESESDSTAIELYLSTGDFKVRHVVTHLGMTQSFSITLTVGCFCYFCRSVSMMSWCPRSLHITVKSLEEVVWMHGAEFLSNSALS